MDPKSGKIPLIRGNRIGGPDWGGRVSAQTKSAVHLISDWAP